MAEQMLVMPLPSVKASVVEKMQKEYEGKCFFKCRERLTLEKSYDKHWFPF